ncbi:hypothetical protein IGI04_013004 [Brassica rapa subsp. trilocularis]|uniref:Neprosin PEP catalytic domain-containing protein n=1 Tax=Brassica rapa subsp. trilocularis TaxID=1813537 RepID=A0ABQ7N9Y5_BRACM|nr:hypothetical protein IGI04_013004 [Brassica rapa subsp. trilocularis]
MKGKGNTTSISSSYCWENSEYDAAVMTRVVVCFIVEPQINSNIAMEASISPVSGYCNLQYDISILIWKDPKEDNDGCNLANGYVIGYLPSFLFSYLTESASMIE